MYYMFKLLIMMQLVMGMLEELILDLMSNLVGDLMCRGLFRATRATMVNMRPNFFPGSTP